MSRKITFLTLFLWLMTLTFPVIAVIGNFVSSKIGKVKST